MSHVDVLKSYDVQYRHKELKIAAGGCYTVHV